MCKPWSKPNLESYRWGHWGSDVKCQRWVCLILRATLVVKNLPAVQEAWRRHGFDQEGPLEKEMATHSSIFVWRIQWTEELGVLQSKGLQRVRHDWVTKQQQKPVCCLPPNADRRLECGQNYQMSWTTSSKLLFKVSLAQKIGTELQWLSPFCPLALFLPFEEKREEPLFFALNL